MKPDEKTAEPQITLCICGQSHSDECKHEWGGWRAFEDGNGGDLKKVVVLSPKNMAGFYHVSLARSCSAVAYHQHSETV